MLFRSDRVYFVEYRDLTKNPKETLQKLHEFLDEEPYEYDFNNITNIHRENDMNTYGLSDMHEVRSKLKSIAPNPKEILSDYVLERCVGMDFWRQKQYNGVIQQVPKIVETSSRQTNIVRN